MLCLAEGRSLLGGDGLYAFVLAAWTTATEQANRLDNDFQVSCGPERKDDLCNKKTCANGSEIR